MLDRIASVFRRARVIGGWDDDNVAALVLKELGLDENGERIPIEPSHTSSEIGHG